MSDFITALKVGYREFRTAWRNLRLMREFDNVLKENEMSKAKKPTNPLYIAVQLYENGEPDGDCYVIAESAEEAIKQFKDEIANNDNVVAYKLSHKYTPVTQIVEEEL